MLDPVTVCHRPSRMHYRVERAEVPDFLADNPGTAFPCDHLPRRRKAQPMKPTKSTKSRTKGRAR